MATKDPRIDAYITKSADFAKPILKHLRKVVHDGCPDVVETIKWSMPHFDYKGVMAGMAAFKQHCAFGFWKADLIVGSDETREKSGMGSFGCIRSLADLPDEKTLIGYVRKAAALNDARVKAPGRTQPKKRKPLPMPADFAAALTRTRKRGRLSRSFHRAIDANTSSGSRRRSARKPERTASRKRLNGSPKAERGTGNTCRPKNSSAPLGMRHGARRFHFSFDQQSACG
jgi:hypothetical protein